MSELLFKEEVYLIQGALFEVYKELGCGFLESVYQECLKIEFQKSKIPFIEQKDLRIKYKGELLSQTYKPDFICYDKIIIEIKAVKILKAEHKAQLFNYLKAAHLRLGLLVNFGHFPKIEIERIII